MKRLKISQMKASPDNPHPPSVLKAPVYPAGASPLRSHEAGSPTGQAPLRAAVDFSTPDNCPMRYPSTAPKIAETTMRNSGFELSAAVSASSLPDDNV